MLKGLSLIKKSSWTEVFATWKSQEGSDPIWQEFARREKGWDSWEAWRSHASQQWSAASRDWSLYSIENPNESIPDFLLGPFKAWQGHFDEKLVHTFRDLVAKKQEWVRENSGIKSRLNKFPADTQLIGVYLPKSDQIMILEGHHRCSAVALAVASGTPIHFEKAPVIALTTIDDTDLALFEKLISFDSRHPNLQSS